MAIHVSVQYNGELLPDVRYTVDPMLLHRGTRLNAMKKFCICSLWFHLNVLKEIWTHLNLPISQKV